MATLGGFPRDREQMGCVLGAADTGSEYEVIAGTFAVMPQLAAGDPEQGIEPVNGLEHVCGDGHDPIAAEHVRELVMEHGSNPILGPCLGSDGQENGWIHDSPRGEHRRVLARQNADGTP